MKCVSCGSAAAYGRKTMTPKYRCSACSYMWDELEHSPEDDIEFQRLHDKVVETLTSRYRHPTTNEIGWADTVEYRMFKHLLNNRGRTVTYAELYKIEFRREMPSDPRHIAEHSGFQWARKFLDETIGDIRKKIEVNPRNPKIILKRPGIGYTIPVTGQLELNDEGPLMDRPSVSRVTLAVKDASSEIGKGLWWLFCWGIIIVGVVLFFLVLMISG